MEKVKTQLWEELVLDWIFFFQILDYINVLNTNKLIWPKIIIS
jgi:hypothetical protein